MPNTECKKDAQSRIIYVEPNDVWGHIGNVPITPDYTDFCISFDLIVDVVSRMRANSMTIDLPVAKTYETEDGSKMSMKTFVFSWTSKYNPNKNTENSDPDRVSFMTGERYGTRNYLTTYYTDTHYNDFKNKTIVEGLGVESVSISFESYYTPTVKIRFIDVRGASIFGREEVLHTDEVLAEDNIWGCFFTFPYPKYRLQVKGFYGKAVTYQLCCTDFRAKFNSKTGNYEIDTTFLGYDFGLLADIPMQYLIAAPYCDYADTMAHWEKNKTSEDWRMSDGGEAVPFYKIRQLIGAAIEKYGAETGPEITTEQIEQEVVDSEKDEILTKMKPYMDAIAEYYKAYMLDYIDQLGKESTAVQIIQSSTYPPMTVLIQSEPKKYEYEININEEIVKKAKDGVPKLFELINEYIKRWPNDGFEKIDECYGEEYDFHEKPRVVNGVNYYKYWEKVPNTLPIESKVMHGNTIKYNYSNGVESKPYVRLNKLFTKYNNAVESTKSVQTVTKEVVSSQTNNSREKIQTLVGFLPNIGNVFRTLYCHLETFTHMLYRCADNIYAQKLNNDRSPDKLGIGLTVTDMYIDGKGDNQIDPFPQVYGIQKPNNDQDGEDVDSDEMDDETQVNAWIGDVRGNAPMWEEELLVEKLFKAVLHTKMDGTGDSVSFNSSNYPVLPCDLNHNTIAGIGLKTNVTDLAGYLAIRAAALFGMAQYYDKEAEAVGKADAFNYFESVASKSEIKSKILDALGNGNKADALYNIALCEGDYANANKPMSFEISENLNRLMKTNKQKRHPFYYINNSGNLQYCYTEDDSSNAFVPIRLGDWGEINDDVLVYHGGASGSYYTFKIVNGGSNILHRINVYKLTDDLDEDDKKIYTNNEIFTVYYGGNYGDGSSIVEKVEKIYANLKDGAVSLNGFTKESDPNRFKTLIENHWWNVDQSNFDDNYMTRLQSLYPSLELLNVDKSKIGLGKFDGTFPDKIYNKNVNKSNGVFTFDDSEIAQEETFALFPELLLFYENGSLESNVFTSKIYYQQNDTSHFGTHALKWSNRNEASDYMKAMLFLLTLDHVADNQTVYLDNNAIGAIEAVPMSIVLFHGALLWRKRFYEKNDKDPLNYGDIIEQIPKTKVPIIKNGERMNRGLIQMGKKGTTIDYMDFSEIMGSTMDYSVQNKLIEKFEDFVKGGDWKTIKENCELKTKKGEQLPYSEFEKLCNSTDIKKDFEEICGSFTGYRKKFSTITTTSSRQSLASLLDEENPAQSTIKKIYLSKVIAQKTVCDFSDKNGTFSIKPSTFKNYLNGFVKQIDEICNSETVNSLQNSTEQTNERDVDIKRLIYMFLKNMWDRWFCQNSKDTFTVKNYMRNTIFIDSMYRNVYTHLHINCEILHDLLNDSDGKAMAFKFLSDLTTKHHCMYFALPDYLNLGEPDGKTARDGMESLFKAYPYSEINKVETFNRYIVMFTHKPSEINSDTNSYKYDSFDIYSHDDDKKNILPTFDREAMKGVKGTSEHDIQCTRYGYNLPAFGVQFGRQSNAIFKNIDVGMQNPVQTEQAINALSLIASRGRGAGERTIFYGQDLYNVYSGYSYTTTIEMMGNAQIMPLMYFQLFNVPMFRGAYMIYGVQHTMRPGDMTTTVKAMKMSKHTLPWCQEWYGHYYFDGEGNIINSYDDMCGAISGDTPWMSLAFNEFNNGTKEVPPKSNSGPAVDKFWKEAGFTKPVAWCALFVYWCLKHAAVDVSGLKGPGAPSSYLQWGTPLDKPAYGAIAVCYGDGPNNAPSHAGFVCGITNKGEVVILGGNQGDAVTKSTYQSRQGNLIKYVMPKGYPIKYNLPNDKAASSPIPNEPLPTRD